MDASKVNVLPKVEEPTVSKKRSRVCYNILSGHFRSGRPDAPLYRKRKFDPALPPGYVRAGYGNYGNFGYSCQLSIPSVAEKTN